MKKKFELLLLSFVLTLLIFSLPVLKNKKIIVHLPTSHSAIVDVIKNNKDLSIDLSNHKTKRFFSKEKNILKKQDQKNSQDSKL